MDDNHGIEDIVHEQSPPPATPPPQQLMQEVGEKLCHRNVEEEKREKQRTHDHLVGDCVYFINRIAEKCECVGSGKRPLNVVILGQQGCGKSSFINSLAASLSLDCWIEYTITGYRDSAQPITSYITQHPNCCNGDNRRHTNVLLPTLIDIPGMLEDNVDERMNKFLKLLFYGHVKDLAAATHVYSDCSKDWDDLLTTYSLVYEDMKVDRGIFVASAVNENLPRRLMDCVISAARPSPNSEGFKRQIPVYGVLTNYDRVSDTNREQYEKIKQDFMRGLGLHQGRFLSCSNYCDDTDPDQDRFWRTLPSLDLPILKFFVQVCERRVPTIYQNDVLPVDLRIRIRAAWRRLGSTWQAVVISLLVALFAFVMMYILVPTLFTSQDSTLQQRCTVGDTSVLEQCQV